MVQPDVVKRIADFVRLKTCQLQLTNFPDLDADDGVASFFIESGLEKVWSPHDEAVIKAKFKRLKKVENNKLIKAKKEQ